MFTHTYKDELGNEVTISISRDIHQIIEDESLFERRIKDEYKNHITDLPDGRYEALPSTEDVEESAIITLAAIDNAVRFARDFEDEFVKIVVSEKYRQIQLTQRQNQRKLDATRKREQELDIMFSRIYEDNALGKLPDSQYQKLLHKYQEEYDILREQIRFLETVVKEEHSNEMDVNNFLKVVQKYTRVNQLTPAILREFIHHIVVHHRESIGKETFQEVEIHFNFIGEVNLPDVEQRRKLIKSFGKEKREQIA